MGVKHLVTLLLVLMVFISLCSSSSPASSQENEVKDRKTNEHTNFGTRGGGVSGSRGGIGGGAVGGTRGGVGSGAENGGGKGDNGNGRGAGVAVIPIYTAGAAGSRNHHSAAVRKCAEFPTVAAIVFIFSLMLNRLVF